MQTSTSLRELLRSIHKKSYPAYRSLKGTYQFPHYILSIDHVQGDPFAAPSHVTAKISMKKAGFPDFSFKDTLSCTTLADYLLRKFEKQIRRVSFQAKGSGKSGLISCSHCGQEVLSRTACEITPEEILVRFHIGFPANGRTINSVELEKILFDFLPSCLEQAFFYRFQKKAELQQAIFLSEDQQALRQELASRHLIAFVADGSLLPRESGVSPLPMKQAALFSSPDSLRVSLTLPHHGPITGMGIPEGITLIIGGGYHGKSTLLNALEAGVYNHISGDGREYVITDDSALKLRSEDGRFVKDVDISLFINDLPNGTDTHHFSTEDASGSTSQAAGIIEGIEAKSRVFLLDEDTSATNFMVRDAFMQRVIAPEKEPITPFLARARDLYQKAGISTVLVAGSSGAFFHIADTVIQMDHYLPADVTAQTKALCSQYPLSDRKPSAFTLPSNQRIMTTSSDKPSIRRNYRTGEVTGQEERLKIKVHSKDRFSIGKQEVDLRYIEQLVDSEQTAALAFLLKYATEHWIDQKRTLPEIIELLQTELKKKGPSFFKEGGHVSCGYALPRLQEIYSCFNRYRRS